MWSLAKHRQELSVCIAQVGGTAVVGTYLLAPASAAVLMPAAIATVVALPPAAVIRSAAGTFLKSILQRQGQVSSLA
jgi:hypothetical protein